MAQLDAVKVNDAFYVSRNRGNAGDEMLLIGTRCIASKAAMAWWALAISHRSMGRISVTAVATSEGRAGLRAGQLTGRNEAQAVSLRPTR